MDEPGDAITTFPVTSPFKKFQRHSPHLEYEIYTYQQG